MSSGNNFIEVVLQANSSMIKGCCTFLSQKKVNFLKTVNFKVEICKKNLKRRFNHVEKSFKEDNFSQWIVQYFFAV